MVGLLIRMHWAMQRDGLRGARRFWAIVGVLLAIGTVALSILRIRQPVILVDLLAALSAAWTVILALAPVFGGVGRGIRPEHLALLPIPPRRLAIGLLGAAVVGVVPAIALVAFAALAVYGFQLGLLPGLAGALAVLLHLLLGVLLGRLVSAVMGVAMQTRLGMEIVALLFGLFLATVSVGWFVLEPVVGQIGRILAEGWPPAIGTVFRLLPSGWGWLAIDTAGRGAWGLTAAIFLVFAGLIGGLLLLWAALLARGTSPRPVSYAVRSRPLMGHAAALLRLPPTPVGAVIAKELRTWRRDPWRVLNLRIALWTGLLIGLIPLLIGWLDLLPFVGVVIVLMAGALSGNLYAADGSALWQTLLTPGAARIDVRGRQWAWLLVWAPVAILATVILIPLSGQHGAWPLVLSLLLATLGGRRLVPLFSVRYPSPGLDPLWRRNPTDSSGGALNEVFFMPWLTALTGLPAAGVVWLGYRLQSPALQWAGLPVGLVAGAAFAWGLGRTAYRRLERSGPEMLDLLLKGASESEKTPEEMIAAKAWRELPLWKKVVVWLCGGLFWIPFSLQGILPIVLKLNGYGEPPLRGPSWILAFHFPAAFQWPVILAMLALGVSMAVMALWIPRRHRQEVRQREKGASRR